MYKVMRACVFTGKVLNEENQYPPSKDSTIERFFETEKEARTFIEEYSKKEFNVEYHLYKDNTHQETLYAPSKNENPAYLIKSRETKKWWQFWKSGTNPQD